MRSNTSQCFGRKEIRELGMTLVINARKKAPSPHLYKALLMAQVKPTSLHAHVELTIPAKAHTHEKLTDLKLSNSFTYREGT